MRAAILHGRNGGCDLGSAGDAGKGAASPAERGRLGVRSGHFVRRPPMRWLASLLVLTTALMLSSCSSKTVTISGCKPAAPPDDCTPPDCYGGGIECQWDITSNS